ncbi:MAG: signal peptidase II [Ignavibacteriales bacterium]|nr:signal peptidase II [Ignavibacteriales bacterium]
MRILYVTLAVLVVDQLTKLTVKGFSIPWLGVERQGMRYGESVNVIGEFLRITYVENPGMAFGLELSPGLKLGVSIFSIVAIVGLVWYLHAVRDHGLPTRLGLALILSGAAGNLIDRMLYGVMYHTAPLFYGKVVDFISVDFFDFSLFGKTYERWPIFNVADAAVTVGVALLLIFAHKHTGEEKDAEKAPTDESLEPALDATASDAANGGDD